MDRDWSGARVSRRRLAFARPIRTVEKYKSTAYVFREGRGGGGESRRRVAGCVSARRWSRASTSSPISTRCPCASRAPTMPPIRPLRGRPRTRGRASSSPSARCSRSKSPMRLSRRADNGCAQHLMTTADHQETPTQVFTEPGCKPARTAALGACGTLDASSGGCDRVTRV